MSTVEIALPRLPSSGGDIPAFFKQLELCVHHARKAYQVQVENAEGSREDDFVEYGTPELDKAIAATVMDDYVRKDHASETGNHYSIDTVDDVRDNLSDEHESIILRINVG